MPAGPRVLVTRCPSCRVMLRQGESCDHTFLSESGQAYEVHPQHQFEPAQYAHVWFEVVGSDELAPADEGKQPKK